MDIIHKALKIALIAHEGQKDKAGESYILHPLRIMSKMETTEEKAIALLHDVIEDSDFAANDLLNEGLSKTIVDAVLALTKNDGEDYDQFVERILKNKLATKVKIADIEDNINVLRLNSLSDKDLQRVAKYHKSWQKLTNSS